MLKLKDSSDIIITEEITDYLISEDPLIIKNRLLDGTYHVQTIGSSVKKNNLTIKVNEAGKLKIDEAFAECKPLKFETNDKYYIGTIDSKPSYSYLKRENSPQYSIDFSMNITTEGLL